jgi:hypothetical protein
LHLVGFFFMNFAMMHGFTNIKNHQLYCFGGYCFLECDPVHFVKYYSYICSTVLPSCWVYTSKVRILTLKPIGITWRAGRNCGSILLRRYLISLYLTKLKLSKFVCSRTSAWLNNYKTHCRSSVNLRLTLRLLMSYIYMEHLFLMFLDHTQRRSTVGRTPLDE